MQVIVLADERLKQELLACPVAENIHLQWITETGDTPDYSADACIDLLFENKAERITWLKQFKTDLIIVSSVINPLEEIKEDFVRINGWHTFLKRPVTEASCKNETLKKKAEALFLLLGRTLEWVPDIAGFVTPRIVAAVINEAFMALEEKVSEEKETDTAMRLGTNYPYGPFEWAEEIGERKVYDLLVKLQDRQLRYKPSSLLKQKVLA